MQQSRRTIVDHLKRHPGATVSDLSRAASLAPITVRAHLAVLTSDGLVRSRDVRGARGRPFRTYFLTERAEPHFPRHYDQLALSLLSGLESVGDERLIQALVTRVAQDMAQPLRARVDGKPLAERVATVAAFIEEQGGAADWTETDGRFVVYERNCPYLTVSRCSDHVCEIDRQVVAELTGAHVQVHGRLRDGADACTFVISAETTG